MTAIENQSTAKTQAVPPGAPSGISAVLSRFNRLCRLIHDMSGPYATFLYVASLGTFVVALAEGGILIVLVPFALGALGADGEISGVFAWVRDIFRSEDGQRSTMAMVIAMIGALALRTIAGSATQMMTMLAEARIVTFIREGVVKNLMASRFSYLDTVDKGWIQFVNISMAQTCGGTAVRLMMTIATRFLTVCVMIVLLFQMSVQMTLASIAVASLLVPFKLAYGRRVHRASKIAVDRQKNLVDYMSEIATNIRHIKIVGATGRMTDELADRSRRAKMADYYVNYLMALQPIIIIVSAFVLIVCVLLGANLSGSQAIGLLVFMGVLYRTLAPITEIGTMINKLLNMVPMIETVWSFFDLPESRLEPTGGHLINADGPTLVALEDVEFDYGDGVPVLKGINLEVRRGEMVAVVGRSGAGKSSLLHLLLKMYEPTNGRLTVDGMDLGEIDREDWRRQIGFVSQNVQLFTASISDNIRLGRELPDATIEQAAQAADAHNFIAAQRDGYDTAIGEFGMRLSGGQRQRLLLAQALARDPSLMILDEATSAVDPESERLIMDRLDVLRANRMVLLVTHRVANTARADRIYMMQNGHIVETGTYAELIARRGEFWRLCELAETQEDPILTPSESA